METELFNVTTNDQSKRLMKKIHFWAIFFYVCTIISCIFDLINAYTSYRIYANRFSQLPMIFKVQTAINVIFLIVYAIILPIQSYFFYRFTGQSKRSMQYGNSKQYNDSFKWLLKHIILASFLFALNSLWAISLTIMEAKISGLYSK